MASGTSRRIVALQQAVLAGRTYHCINHFTPTAGPHLKLAPIEPVNTPQRIQHELEGALAHRYFPYGHALRIPGEALPAPGRADTLGAQQRTRLAALAVSPRSET